jgi:hypothetical protein
VGDSLPFWERACDEQRANACARLLRVEAAYCSDNSAWACNELGVHYREGKRVGKDVKAAGRYLAKACELRFQAACANLLDDGRTERAPPRPLDLRLLLREGGSNLMHMPESDLYARACEHGWSYACSPLDSTGRKSRLEAGQLR